MLLQPGPILVTPLFLMISSNHMQRTPIIIILTTPHQHHVLHHPTPHNINTPWLIIIHQLNPTRTIKIVFIIILPNFIPTYITTCPCPMLFITPLLTIMLAIFFCQLRNNANPNPWHTTNSCSIKDPTFIQHKGIRENVMQHKSIHGKINKNCNKNMDSPSTTNHPSPPTIPIARHALTLHQNTPSITFGLPDKLYPPSWWPLPGSPWCWRPESIHSWTHY